MKNVRPIPTFLSVALIGSLLSVPVAAEDRAPSRGRLSDGRAFRVDPHGNQLIDYIAELELSVEELTARSNRIEGMLREKDALLTACTQRAKESSANSSSSDALQKASAPALSSPDTQTVCAPILAECELKNKSLRDDYDIESIKMRRSLAACNDSTLAHLRNVTKDETARASFRPPTAPQVAPGAEKQ